MSIYFSTNVEAKITLWRIILFLLFLWLGTLVFIHKPFGNSLEGTILNVAFGFGLILFSGEFILEIKEAEK